VSTQLRLVETPPVAPSERPVTPRVRRARAVPAGRARRAARWNTSWQLDAKARRVGREGVAAARQALIEATDPGLSKAS
jgi:hypothetical protein